MAIASSGRSAVPAAAVAVTTPRRQKQSKSGQLITRLLSLLVLVVASSCSSSSFINNDYGEAAAASATAFVPMPLRPAVLRRRSTVGSAPTFESNMALALRSGHRYNNSFGPARVSATVYRCCSSVATARVSKAAHQYCNSFRPGRGSTAYDKLSATSATNGDVDGGGGSGGGGGGGSGGGSATALDGVGRSAGGTSSTKSHGFKNENISQKKRLVFIIAVRRRIWCLCVDLFVCRIL